MRYYSYCENNIVSYHNSKEIFSVPTYIVLLLVLNDLSVWANHLLLLLHQLGLLELLLHLHLLFLTQHVWIDLLLIQLLLHLLLEGIVLLLVHLSWVHASHVLTINLLLLHGSIVNYILLILIRLSIWLLLIKLGLVLIYLLLILLILSFHFQLLSKCLLNCLFVALTPLMLK